MARAKEKLEKLQRMQPKEKTSSGKTTLVMEAVDCCFCTSNSYSLSNSSGRLCECCYQRIRRLIFFVADPRTDLSIAKIAGAFGDPDILVKPGRGKGPAIPAHRVVLEAKSVIFKTMLDHDICKAPPGDSITFPEMNHKQLQTFLEFLYSGQLTRRKVEMHAICLLHAAHKYDIPCLEELCEQAMISSLNCNSVWNFLDIADTLGKETLKYAALDYIKYNASAVFSVGFDSLIHENPDLALLATRVLCSHLFLERELKS